MPPEAKQQPWHWKWARESSVEVIAQNLPTASGNDESGVNMSLHNLTVSQFWQGLKCDTIWESVFFKEQRTERERDSHSYTNTMLAGPTWSWPGSLILSGTVQESVAGVGRLVSLLGSRKLGLFGGRGQVSWWGECPQVWLMREVDAGVADEGRCGQAEKWENRNLVGTAETDWWSWRLVNTGRKSATPRFGAYVNQCRGSHQTQKRRGALRLVWTKHQSCHIEFLHLHSNLFLIFLAQKKLHWN